MIRYIFKKSFAYGIMFFGIGFGLLAESFETNYYGIERMVVMFACVVFGYWYNEIIEGRMEKHGRC